MQKKKKDRKFGSATSHQEAETNDLPIKEDQNQSGVSLTEKNTRTGSPSHDNAPSLNQQYPQILQWPYTPQPAMEQTAPLISKPCVPTQSPSPVVISRCQRLQHQQPSPTNHQAQHGHPPLHLAQSTTPFWLPQRPAGYHLPGANAPQPFSPLGMADASWQGPAATGGGISSINQPQIPSFCYHVGYPYPGFPGPWDPSSWWGQGQQSQSPCTYTLPAACGYFSLPPPMPGCSAAFGQSFQRGIIRPTAKLSQKHQQLWEAQSAENVQLWMVIGHLQTELADYKSRLMKLEAETLSLKPTIEEPAAHGTRIGLAGQTSKRGRPRRPVASVDVLPSPDKSHPRTRGRIPALCKVQSETKELNFEKESLNKVEDKEKAGHSTATIQQANDGKITNIFTNSSGNIEISESNSAFQNQIQEDIPGVQIGAVGHNSSSEMKGDDKGNDSESAFSILSWHVRGIKTKDAYATCMGPTNNVNLGWPSNITSEDCGRDLLNISSQGFYNNGSGIRQGRKVVPGWSFVKEDDASGELEDAVVGSAKDEDEEEMEDDASSGAEEIARIKDEAAYNMDAPGGSSSRGLPQLNSW